MNHAEETRFDPSLLDQINRQMAQESGRIAIRTPDSCVSYGQLDDLGNRIAAGLASIGDVREQPIAVLSSNAGLLAGVLLACLRTGAIYSPIDPEQPAVRIRQIVENLGAMAIVTEFVKEPLVRELADSSILVLFGDRLEENTFEPVNWNSLPTSRILWIMYTSGSMGTPKGVMQSESNASRFAWQVTNALGLKESECLFLASSLNSHAGAVMCLATLCCAATFCSLDFRTVRLENLPNFLDEHRVTVLFTVPGILGVLRRTGIMAGRRLPALRLVRLSGEAVNRETIEGCWSMFPSLKEVSVGYGTTETGGISQIFFKRDHPLPDNPVPVGRKIQGLNIMILDEEGSPMGVDEFGEIAVVSGFLSQGYWKDSEFSQKVFRRLDDGSKFYATGDLGKLQADGTLVLQGRLDVQVKIMGNRIDPREIEFALIGFPEITEAVVKPMQGDNSAAFVAYCVSKSGCILDVDQLRRRLSRILPFNMIPRHLVRMDRIPRTRTGKIAYDELPHPPSAAARLPPLAPTGRDDE